MKTISLRNWARNVLLALIAGSMLAACGGGDSQPAQAQTKLLADASCNYANWVEGKAYVVGNIVRYAPNGLYYKASHDNPGYNPTISTYFWDKYTCTATTTTTKAATTTTVAGCNYANWVEGKNYVVGNIVRYSPNGLYYKASHDNPGYNPTISTYFWDQYACTGTTTTTKAGSGNGKIIGGYYPNWKDTLRVRDLPANYNLVYLFSAYAAPGDTSGKVSFAYPPGAAGTNLNADIAYARSSQGRKILLSVGGAGHGMFFHNRTESQTFFNSIVAIYNQLGGIDGLDWNTFEADTAPSTNEMIWISQQLKQRYGAGFLITAPPAPWNQLDKDFCKAMVQAGAMDYAAPQYYDGPSLNLPSYVVPNAQEWINLLGASHVVIGFGINSTANYMTTAQATSIWNSVKAANPSIRGGFDWEINTDQAQGWPFANTVGALIKQ